MGRYGMTDPKPGPIKESSVETARSAGSDGGGLGNDMGSESDWFSPAGNMSKGELGGDNRGDLGMTATPGAPSPGEMMSNEYDWQGDRPLHVVEGTPSREEIKRWFRGGS